MGHISRYSVALGRFSKVAAECAWWAAPPLFSSGSCAFFGIFGDKATRQNQILFTAVSDIWLKLTGTYLLIKW